MNDGLLRKWRLNDYDKREDRKQNQSQMLKNKILNKMPARLYLKFSLIIAPEQMSIINSEEQKVFLAQSFEGTEATSMDYLQPQW